MNPEDPTYDEDTLRQDLRVTRDHLDTLVDELREVDVELGSLESERAQYRLVEQVCAGLTELEALGAGELFWSGRHATSSSQETDQGADHLRMVRGRVDGFEKRIHEIDERRQTILDELQLQEDAAEFIAGSILEAERLEEQKKFEWLIERGDALIPIRDTTMPWARGGEDDQRFRKTLATSLVVALLLSIILPMIDIPLPDRWEVLEEQERITQLIRENIPEPPPVVQLAKAKPVVKDESKPTEIEAPIAAEELVAEAAPADIVAEKPSAESKGILAFRDKFSSLASSDAVDRLGSNARIKNPGQDSKTPAARSMVTSQAASTSGGINVASLSRDMGGQGQNLGGLAVTQATSSIGTGNGSGSDRPLAGGGPGLGRTDEEIQIVFDRHKAALYRMYNRELRKNPSLKGQMVLRFTIQPDGSVSMSELKSTNMKSPNLSKQVVARVATFDFGAKEGIPAMTIAYPIDFLPAT